MRGPLWLSAGVEHTDGVVVVDVNGMVAAAGPAATVAAPADADEVRTGWVGPGLVDAHVHLAFADPVHVGAGGVVAVCDLGAPPADATRWRQLAFPRVNVAGPLLTAPGGYPSRSWGSAGFAAFVDDVEQTTRLVSALTTQVDIVKLALEPAGGPVPSPEVAAAVIEAAHAGGRRVTAHALTVEMVVRALDAGVDQLAHTPTQALPAELVARIAAAGVDVVSTLQTFAGGDEGRVAIDNAAALAAAGVTLRYGTDLGNAGTRPGADPRELTVLARDVGFGADGVLAIATEPIVVGEPAALVALRSDPRSDPDAWRRPLAVVVGATVLLADPKQM